MADSGFELLGIPFLVGKIKFKLFFQGPLAKWGIHLQYKTEIHNRDYFINHEIRIPNNQPVWLMESKKFFFLRVSLVLMVFAGSSHQKPFFKFWWFCVASTRSENFARSQTLQRDGEKTTRSHNEFTHVEKTHVLPCFFSRNCFCRRSWSVNKYNVILMYGSIWPFFWNKHHVSHEKKPGWLGYIGDYTIQLYRAL